jgi:hypothetical protein
MGIKLVVDETAEPKRKVVRMCDMEPLQVGRIIENSPRNGCLVMRTASASFEVMNMTNPSLGAYWSDLEVAATLRVELAKNGERFAFEVIEQ